MKITAEGQYSKRKSQLLITMTRGDMRDVERRQRPAYIPDVKRLHFGNMCGRILDIYKSFVTAEVSIKCAIFACLGGIN